VLLIVSDFLFQPSSQLLGLSQMVHFHIITITDVLSWIKKLTVTLFTTQSLNLNYRVSK